MQVFGDLAVALEDVGQGEATLEAIVKSAIDIVPGAQWAGISLICGREVRPVAPSDELVAVLDKVQSTANDGPCLNALRQHHTVHVENMDTERRWPEFVAAARERGIGSLLSFQLFSLHDNLGALNMYAARPFAFTEEAIGIGAVLAQHASVAVAGSTAAMAGTAVQSQLQSALLTRDVIGQAKGILMHRAHVDADMAFRMMVRVSQSANIKITEIARQIVADHLSSLDR